MKMKSLIIVGSIFMAFYFEVISARNLLKSKSNADKWLAMELEDVNRQCKLNVDYLINYKIFEEYVHRFREYMEQSANLDADKFNYILKFSYNPNLVEALNNLIKRIQDCLDDENRLNSNDLVEVLEKILHLHARKVMLVDPIGVEDVAKCSLSLMNKRNEYKCVHATETIGGSRKVKTIFQLLAGYYNGPMSCEELLPMEQCFMKFAEDCTPAIRKLWRIAVSPPDIGICENFSQEPDPILTNGINNIVTAEIQK